MAMLRSRRRWRSTQLLLLTLWSRNSRRYILISRPPLRLSSQRVKRKVRRVKRKSMKMRMMIVRKIRRMIRLFSHLPTLWCVENIGWSDPRERRLTMNKMRIRKKRRRRLMRIKKKTTRLRKKKRRLMSLPKRRLWLKSSRSEMLRTGWKKFARISWSFIIKNSVKIIYWPWIRSVTNLRITRTSKSSLSTCWTSLFALTSADRWNSPISLGINGVVFTTLSSRSTTSFVNLRRMTFIPISVSLRIPLLVTIPLLPMSLKKVSTFLSKLTWSWSKVSSRRLWFISIPMSLSTANAYRISLVWWTWCIRSASKSKASMSWSVMLLNWPSRSLKIPILWVEL